MTPSTQPRRGGLLLVRALEPAEDPLPAIVGIGRHVERDRDELLVAAEPHARRKLSDASPTTRSPSCSSVRSSRGPAGLSSNHQSNSARSRSLAPDPLEQVEHRVSVGRFRAHLVDVPSAAFNARRACVPATVSLTEIRSHAPASTSSNVRGGYGSTL